MSIKKAQTNSSEPNVISINPFRCRVWAEHGRLEEWVTEKSCEAELKSIAAHGQITPVLVRRVTDDPSYDFELICGTRRLFVTRFLNLPLKAQIRELSDREAVIALDVENRHRKDISPYERGTSYKRWLKVGHFKCQEELARALEISPSQVSRMLKLAQLPAVIVDAFAAPIEIRESWGVDLYDSWQDPEGRRLVADRARLLARQVPRLSADKVYETLRAPAGLAGKKARSGRVEVVLGDDGMPLFRVKHLRRNVALMVPARGLHEELMERLKGAVAAALQQATGQPAIAKSSIVRGVKDLAGGLSARIGGSL